MILLRRNEELTMRLRFDVERLSRLIEQRPVHVDGDVTGHVGGSQLVLNTLLLAC